MKTVDQKAMLGQIAREQKPKTWELRVMTPRASFSGRRKPTSQFGKIAACAKVSEEQLIKAVFSRLDEGRFTECLKMQVQAKFDDWINKHNLLDGSDFWIDIKFSRKSSLRCRCNMDLSGDEPLLKVRQKVFCAASNVTRDKCLHFLIPISSLDPREVFDYPS